MCTEACWKIRFVLLLLHMPNSNFFQVSFSSVWHPHELPPCYGIHPPRDFPHQVPDSIFLFLRVCSPTGSEQSGVRVQGQGQQEGELAAPCQPGPVPCVDVRGWPSSPSRDRQVQLQGAGCCSNGVTWKIRLCP